MLDNAAESSAAAAETSFAVSAMQAPTYRSRVIEHPSAATKRRPEKTGAAKIPNSPLRQW